MARRILTTAGSLTIVPALGWKVHAASQQPQGKILAKELSIYDNPQDDIKLEYIPEDPSYVQKTFSSWRLGIKQFLHKDEIKGKTERVEQIWGTSKAHTQNLVGYLQDDLVVIPRLAVIFVAGLGGIAVAYRGGIFRKTLYAGIAVTGAAVLCYPQQARELTDQGLAQAQEYSQAGWEAVKGHAKEMWKSPKDKSK